MTDRDFEQRMEKHKHRQAFLDRKKKYRNGLPDFEAIKVWSAYLKDNYPK